MEPARCNGKTCGTSYKKYTYNDLCIHNNLEVLYPKICEQWNYELNKSIPKNYLPGSVALIWWTCRNTDCKCKVWQSTIKSRTLYDTDCYCCEGRLCIHNNLLAMFPQICNEWDYDKNIKLPSEYTYGSEVVVFWKCLKQNCGCHTYEMKITNKTSKDKHCGCPFCSGQRSCKHNNAGAYNPKLLEEWDFVNNINHPSFYVPFSTIEVFLICPKNRSHKWKTSIFNRNNGYVGCPDCKIIDRANYNLLTEYPELCKEWDYDVNDLIPEMCAPHSSTKKVWWSCKNDSVHKWKTSISCRTSDKPTGCPFCNSSRRSEQHNLAVCNSELASQWDYDKNDTIPSDHTPYSHSKVWWKCKKNTEHFWESTIKSRSYGNGCPKCTTYKYSKVQIEWLNYLIKKDNINIIHAENKGEHYIPDVGKVDGYCEETNTVYEFHGDFYHGNPDRFEQEDMNIRLNKTYGELYNKTLKRDKLIISKGYKLVIMWEYEFLKLRKQINKEIKSSNKSKLGIVNSSSKINLQIIEEKELIKIEIKPIKKSRLIVIDDAK